MSRCVAAFSLFPSLPEAALPHGERGAPVCGSAPHHQALLSATMKLGVSPRDPGGGSWSTLWDPGGVGRVGHPLCDPVGVARLYPAPKRCRGRLGWKAVRSRSLSLGRLCFLTKSKNADSQQPMLMDSDCLSFALNNGRNYQRRWLTRCDWISSFSSKLNW